MVPIFCRSHCIDIFKAVARACRRPGLIMMTSSNGNIFRVTGPLCGEFTGPGEFPTQRPVTRSFDVFFDVRLIKRLSKHSRGWWFETLSHPLWRHRNVKSPTKLRFDFYVDMDKKDWSIISLSQIQALASDSTSRTRNNRRSPIWSCNISRNWKLLTYDISMSKFYSCYLLWRPLKPKWGLIENRNLLNWTTLLLTAFDKYFDNARYIKWGGGGDVIVREASGFPPCGLEPWTKWSPFNRRQCISINFLKF